jgi:hypothetical protein
MRSVETRLKRVEWHALDWSSPCQLRARQVAQFAKEGPLCASNAPMGGQRKGYHAPNGVAGEPFSHWWLVRASGNAPPSLVLEAPDLHYSRRRSRSPGALFWQTLRFSAEGRRGNRAVAGGPFLAP